MLLVLAIGMAACATPEILEPKNRVTPEGVDLSGQWQLNIDEGVGEKAVFQAIKEGSTERSVARVSRTRPGTSSRNETEMIIFGPRTGAIVHAFLQTAERLKITQTPHSLFVSFSGSIVEEYTFGESRDIALGAVTAARASGWEGRGYVIETLDKDGRKLTERYYLGDDGNKLYREIVLREKNNKEKSLLQVFNRVSG
jgi:hypothetical protein